MTQTGHADVVRWLLRHRLERCPANRNIFDWVADHGHLSVVKVLHEARVEGCSARAMNWAAKNGHLETLIWLHENRAEVCGWRGERVESSRVELAEIRGAAVFFSLRGRERTAGAFAFPKWQSNHMLDEADDRG